MSTIRYSVFGIRYSGGSRRRRGVSFVELLAAVLILSIVAAGAASTWSLSSRAPANLRKTEITSKIAVQEIEVIKAQKYSNVGNATTTKTTYAWYDTYGAVIPVSGVSRSTTLGSAPTGAVYLATTAIGAPLDASVAADATSGGSISGLSLTGTTKDLVEARTVVRNAANSKTYETQRTLMAFGGF